ncbi:MAG: ribonuclease J, partial [Deferrisomatales bacterium]|nr:ribonuclease J [Deferrisomatales bacterium]
MSAGRTTLLPLGGLGEIGLNCLAVETERDLLLVDCGLLFPRAEQPGVEYLIPDFQTILERREKLRGVVLTHGHEDHIGALPHLLRQVPVPVYGTRFTTALVHRRLSEGVQSLAAHLHTVVAGAEVALGEVRARFLPMAHSIPDACAVALETPGGVVLHSGDFTFDPEPAGGQATDTAALAGWGRRGVDLLCCDSTNALNPGATPPSGGVAAGFARIFPQVEGRTYVALFASNVARMQQVVEASRRCGRRVTPLGRAVGQVSKLARQYGYLRTAPGEWLAEGRCRGLPRGALTVLCGGTQAEPGSALWRVAHGEEPHHRLQPGDAVLFSARAIPGNEGAIGQLLDRCVEAGARVYFGAQDGIHVSGHPGAPELARLLQLTQPRQILPVHGTARHRAAAVRVARDAGWSEETVLSGSDGRAVVLEGGRARWGALYPAGRICVTGAGNFPADAPLLTVRRRMGRDGVALALLDGAAPEWSVRVELCGVCP